MKMTATKTYFGWILVFSSIVIISFQLYMFKKKLYSEKIVAKGVYKQIQDTNTNTTSFLPANSKSNLQFTKIIKFTKMAYGPVYILDVVAGNSSEDKSWDIFKVYASIEYSVYKNESVFKCCLKYGHDNKSTIRFDEKEPVYARKHKETCWLRAHHFTCPNLRHSEGFVPTGVALTIKGVPCNSKKVVYLPPLYPKREPSTKLAIGTKTAFGDVSAELIIEWMEACKNLGVDKVVTYYYKNINTAALKVLKYYATTGLLDLYLFEPAASERYPRKFHPPNRQKWNDQRMVIYDSFEKMSGYTYFGIVDHDEFLIPSRNRTLKEMLADLYATFKGTAGFKFKTEYYYVSWGKSGKVNDIILSAYINRTEFGPKIDYPKLIYKPNLVSPGGVSTHEIQTSNAVEIAPQQEGYIRHFRDCRPQHRKLCLKLYKRVTDMEMADWSTRIHSNVRRARNLIFGDGIGCSQYDYANMDDHTVPGVCSYGYVPLSHLENIVTRIETEQKDYANLCHALNR